MRAWLIGWLIFTVGVAFYLSNRGLATCSSGSYWNKAWDSLAGRGCDLHCRQFRLFRDIELCPGNTLPRTNVVVSPRSYPFLAVVKVADKAHFLPLETLVEMVFASQVRVHACGVGRLCLVPASLLREKYPLQKMTSENNDSKYPSSNCVK